MILKLINKAGCRKNLNAGKIMTKDLIMSIKNINSRTYFRKLEYISCLQASFVLELRFQSSQNSYMFMFCTKSNIPHAQKRSVSDIPEVGMIA